MKNILKVEIGLGVLALGLIYVVISSNASITGFVVGASPLITLVSPSAYTETQSNTVYFIFKYSPELKMNECSLKLNNNVVKTTTTLLSPYDTRIRKELEPGTYYWSIECKDSNGGVFESETRKLVVTEKTNQELKIMRFRERSGTIYEFELKSGLELEIPGVMPNDVLRARRDKNSYEISILMISQDYSRNLEFTQLMITPGQKRLTLFAGKPISIDFNNDGKDDLEIMLNNIAYRKASFQVKALQN